MLNRYSTVQSFTTKVRATDLGFLRFLFHVAQRAADLGKTGAQLCSKVAQKEDEATPCFLHPSYNGRCRPLRLGLLGTEPRITTPGAQTRGEGAHG